MWIVPSLKSNQIKNSLDAFEIMSKNLVVRSEIKAVSYWKSNWDTKQRFSIFFQSRVLEIGHYNGYIQTYCRGLRSALGLHCTRAALIQSEHEYALDWGDLPLFKSDIQSTERICTYLKTKNYVVWDEQLRREYRRRVCVDNTKDWPTPTTQECAHPQMVLTESGRRAPTKGKTSFSLNLWDVAELEQKKMWATPVVGDAHLAMTKPLAPNKLGELRVNTTLRQVCHEEGYRGYLNPRWVETLMGLPIGWVQPSCKSVYFG